MSAHKVALVTGGGRGVGKGVASALGAEGWTVYVTGRHADRLASTAEAITAAGGAGHAMACDHHQDDQVAEVFARIADEQGQLDLLVNNAWANPDGYAGFTQPFWKRPVQDWDSLIGIGLRAHYVACVEAAKIMVPQGSGLMANISSFGSRGYLHSVLYGMSKTALDKMAADMAVELAGTGVTAVSLWLGLVQTERVKSMGDSFEGFSIADAEEPEYIGQVINALAHDEKLRAYNGHTVITAEYGRDHGLTNSDGRQPPTHRPFFGGGPLFPPLQEV
ncbi:SDR family NAD(P)-dependent oxidoreductase [Rhodococcus sp. X156]|uniref:SDR family NAD(P)-dependent oxidoreductase n=1 Tax=Rhodococcus sp. X156 TaxID=2499145 RepID=UPI001F497D5D|nr:SDR family NAD(P)-dependent oxidoreductase [Rhodococcus sp. X156]